MKIRKAKKAQQEVFGFVVIVVLVIVIGIIVLTLGLRRGLSKTQYKEDIVINDLLHSIMEYTTLCGSDYVKLKEVIRKCQNDEKCGNDDACNKINQLDEILNTTLGKGEQLEYGYYRGYQFIVGEGNKINITRGTQEENMIGASYPINIPPPNPGNIEVKLYLWFGAEQEES